MASGLPKDLAMIGASANARFRPWQLSCPKPPSGFSPWRMKTIVSTAFSVCPASPPKSGTGHNKAETTAVLTSTLKVKLRIKLVNSGRSLSVQLRDYNSRPLSAPDTARFRTALSCALRAGSPVYPTARRRLSGVSSIEPIICPECSTHNRKITLLSSSR